MHNLNDLPAVSSTSPPPIAIILQYTSEYSSGRTVLTGIMPARTGMYVTREYLKTRNTRHENKSQNTSGLVAQEFEILVSGFDFAWRVRVTSESKRGDSQSRTLWRSRARHMGRIISLLLFLFLVLFRCSVVCCCCCCCCCSCIHPLTWSRTRLLHTVCTSMPII